MIDYVKDIGMITVILTGTGVIFKFLLNAFKGHLEMLQDHWHDEANRMHVAVKDLHNDLRKNIEVSTKKIDEIGEEVSEVKGAFAQYIQGGRGDTCENYAPR